MPWKKQVARERRHRRDDRIVNDDRAALGDLDPFIHVGSGILATDDVFRWREKSPESDCDESDGYERSKCDTSRCRSESKPPACECGTQDDDGDISQKEALETVTMKDRETENDRQRDGNAQNHAPEDALFGVEGGSAIPIQPWQPEDGGAR